MRDPVNQYHSPEADIRSADTDADSTIIDRLFARSEEGLALLQIHYGKLCHRIALNLLGSREDAEECVNDTYLAVWNTIPPNRPASLMAYVGKVTRNIAVSCLRKRGAKGRRCEGTVLLDELAECLPDTDAPDPAASYKKSDFAEFNFDTIWRMQDGRPVLRIFEE